jgi:ComF family protein
MFRWNKIKLPLEDFGSLLFPRLCQACGEHLVRNEDIVCTSCLFEIPRTAYHKIRDNDLEKNFWGRCMIERAAAYSYYRQGSRMQKLIHRLKYNGIRSVGVFLGRMYGNILMESDFLDGINLICPVPLHRSKQRKRGFNQSAIICDGLSLATGIPHQPDLLIRNIKTSTQTRRSRIGRWQNVEGSVVAADSELLKGKHVLLVDDVITTGSTMEACVNVMKEIEGVRVSVVAMATVIVQSA